MPLNTELTIDQRIQVARIAADLVMHHCKNLTSDKMTLPLSSQITARNEQVMRGDEPAPNRFRDVIEFEQTFEWAYDVVLETVTGESDSHE